MKTFVFLPGWTLPCVRHSLKMLFVSTEDRILCSEHIHQFQRSFPKVFFWVWTCWLLVLLAVFLLAEELNEQCRACFIAFQSIRTSRGINRQHGSPSVSLSPVWGMLSRGKQIHFTLEDAGVFPNAVVVWRIRSRTEYWNIFGKKTKHTSQCVSYYKVNGYIFIFVLVNF